MTKNDLTDHELKTVTGGSGNDPIYKCSSASCTYTCKESTLPPGGICPKCGCFLVEA